MAQTACFYILPTNSLEELRKDETGNVSNKKNWLARIIKPADPLPDKLESFAVDKINYRYSGLAFAILSAFSREKLEADWDDLEYSSIANELSERTGNGIYIFSINDIQLLKLKPTEKFYSLEQLDQFAIEFAGNKPGNPDIMRKAVEVFSEALYRLANDRLVLLAMSSR
ncbi:MAG: hypothetical protein ACXWCG_07035 [Flavitalea sp.]